METIGTKKNSKRGSQNEDNLCFRTSKKRNVAKGSKMESLKYAHYFPQNHLRALRRTDLRKYPKTNLPARVHRDIPKHPKIENITISLYCQQISLETRPKQSLPMRPFGGPLEIPWGPNGALIQREMQTLFSSVQFSCSIVQ